MASGSQYVHAKKYETSEVKWYSQKTKEEPQYLAFLCPTMDEYFKSQIPGKKVLDIACGNGIWCYKAAQYGPKSVDGFDIQEEMVQLAKQATSQFSIQSIYIMEMLWICLMMITHLMLLWGSM